MEENELETIDLRKALLSTDTSAPGGGKLIPEVVSRGIRRFVETRSPIYAVTPKISWPTNAYIFREVNALPEASFLPDGGTLPTRTTGTYDKRFTAMKYIYTPGEVTGPLQAATGNVVDALQYEIELHADALVRTLEQTLISGNSGTNPDEFDGYAVQITQNHDASGAVLTLGMLDLALDIPATYPTNVILNRAMGRRLWSLLQAQQRFIDRTEIAGGFRVPVYNDLPILRVDNDITGLNTTILCPDMRHVVFPINQPIMFEPLAKTKDSDDFMIKMYCTLAVEGAARYHVKLVNVASS